MSTFRWGILGTGKIATAFAEDLSLLPHHNVTSVGSRSITTAAEFAARFPGATAFGSYEELVASDVDAIYVATPHPFHAEHSLLAMRAGKPVLCEKPFTLNAAQAQELIEYSQSNSIPLLEALWSRFLPHIAKIKEVVASGQLGVISTITADHGQYLPRDKFPRLWEPELGGGALLDLGIYPLTLAHIVLGKPSEITAVGTLTEEGMDLQSTMVLKYPSGAQAILTSTMANRSGNIGVISGDLARIEIDGPFYKPNSWRVITRDGDVTEYANSYEGNGLREEAVEFERMVRNGEIESPLMTHAITIEMMEMMDEIRRQIGVRYPHE
jgi:predicted dehydrogenase